MHGFLLLPLAIYIHLNAWFFGSELPETPVSVIAFGSCNNIWNEQPLWNSILQNNPDLWIWLGDNVYGDTDDMASLKETYKIQKNLPAYKNFVNQIPVIGVWDDHDYGRNDAGREYPYRRESKEIFMDFMGIPDSAEVRTHPGVYQAYTYGTGNKKVKVILLDGRSFRDPMNIKFGLKFPNRQGQLLGEQQWQWLEKQLTNSDAAIHIIANGYQILPKHNQYEKWAGFPKERKRLLRLLEEKKPAGVILLSGDRHMGELSETTLKNYPYPVYELTSSGLTHYHKKSYSLNLFRVGEQINALNFGLLKFNWLTDSVKVTMQIRGEENRLYLEKTIGFPLVLNSVLNE